MAASVLSSRLARRIDRLARRAHAFHRFAHHPLCGRYSGELIALRGRARICRGCTLTLTAALCGVLAGSLFALPVLPLVLASLVGLMASLGQLLLTEDPTPKGSGSGVPAHKAKESDALARKAIGSAAPASGRGVAQALARARVSQALVSERVPDEPARERVSQALARWRVSQALARQRVGKLWTRGVPACLLGATWTGLLREPSAPHWILALGLALACAVWLRGYRRRGPDRSPCISCPEYASSQPCSGFRAIVRAERAFTRRGQQLLDAAERGRSLSP